MKWNLFVICFQLGVAEGFSETESTFWTIMINKYYFFNLLWCPEWDVFHTDAVGVYSVPGPFKGLWIDAELNIKLRLKFLVLEKPFQFFVILAELTNQMLLLQSIFKL